MGGQGQTPFPQGLAAWLIPRTDPRRRHGGKGTDTFSAGIVCLIAPAALRKRCQSLAEKASVPGEGGLKRFSPDIVKGAVQEEDLMHVNALAPEEPP